MKINRLFEILYLLSKRRQITAKELAGYFEVSVRTIYRDIESLSMADIPIYTDRGKGGGIKLMDHFVYDQVMFNSLEKQQILTGMNLLAKLNQQDQSTFKKVKTIFNQEDSDWVKIEMGNWRKHNPINSLEIYKEVIQKQQGLTFKYHSQKGINEQRKVQPLQILIKNFQYYLIAYDLKKQVQRTYKLSRIHELQSLDQFFKPKAIEHIDPLPDTEMIAILLKCDQAILSQLDDSFDIRILKESKQSVTIEMMVPKCDWITTYLLSFGSHLTVYSPESLVLKIKKQLTAMTKNYNMT